MKRSIITLTVATLTISGSLTIETIFAKPASAQGPRFNFAPHSWFVDQPTGPRYRFNRTSVAEGTVPTASTLMGFNPGFLLPPPTTSGTSWRFHPQQTTHIASRPSDFGSPSLAPVSIPRQPRPVSKCDPATFQRETKPKQNIFGFIPRPKESFSKHESSKPTVARTSAQNVPMLKPQKVLQYNNDSYSLGSTNPVEYSSGINSKSQVHGRLMKGFITKEK